MRVRGLHSTWVPLLAAGLGLTAAYVLAGRLGLMLAVAPGYATAIFPPAGIAVSAVLIIGAAGLPVTFVGALVLNLWIGYSLAHGFGMPQTATALVIAVGSTLQAAVGAALLRRTVGYPTSLDNARDLLRFFIVCPTACLTSATLSLGGMWALGAIDRADLPTSWFVWWIGDTLGVLVVLPLMLALAGEPRASWRRRGPFVAVPILLFFALFVAIFSQVSSWENDQSLLEFRMRSQHLADVAQASLQEQRVFLEQLGSAFQPRRDRVTRQDFHVLVRRLLQHFSTIQAVEWAPRVEASERAAFEAAERRGQPGFVIRERDAAGGMRPAAPRAFFYPVTYLEPLAGNREAVGYDLWSDHDRRAAIAATLAGGRVTATAPIRLVQEHGRQAGILLTYGISGGTNGPGIVLVVLRMGTFTEHLLAPLGSVMTARFVDTAGSRPLFDNLDAQSSDPVFAASFDFGGRHYSLLTTPTPLYRAEHRSWESWTLLVAGVFSTGLLGALLMLGSGHAQRAQQLVGERTVELQVANRRLVAEMAERERAEAALQHARRMEALGQLTGGVAHDFNNLLTVILGNLDLLRRHLTDEAARRLLSTAEAGAERGVRLIDSLLAFARRQPLRPEVVDPNRLIVEFADLMRRAAGESIELRLMPTAASGVSRIDPAQFQAALLNLVVNARDAMPQGGVLTIETRRVDGVPAVPPSPATTAAGPHIAIVVRDTGLGMRPEVLERAFEPFYTTKEVGRGSGLGLSQVYGFVTQSGGHVQIASQPGAGTEVSVYLPLASSDAAGEPADGAPCPGAAGGQETILVVEDDPEVRRLTTDGLRELGYRVLAAADGQEALAILADGGPIDLLFSDIVMPQGMRGDELARRAVAGRRGLRVLLTSGYAAELPDGDEIGPIALLRKPYRRAELARAIRAALEG